MLTSLSFSKAMDVFQARGFDTHNRCKSAHKTTGIHLKSETYYLVEYLDESTSEKIVYAASLHKATDQGEVMLCLLNNPVWARSFSSKLLGNNYYEHKLTDKFIEDVRSILSKDKPNLNPHS